MTVNLIVAIVFVLLGAAWRVWDGSDVNRAPQASRIRTAWRNLIGLAIAVAAAGFAFQGHPLALVVGGLAALTLIAGHTDWSSWYMVARYGVGTVAGGAVAFLWLLSTGAVPASVAFATLAWGAVAGPLAGAICVILNRQWVVPPSGRWLYDADAWVRAIAGGLIVGGWAAIPALARLL